MCRTFDRLSLVIEQLKSLSKALAAVLQKTILCLVLSALALAEAEPSPHQDLQKITQRGVLKVAMHAVDHPPFFMHDNHGNLVGLDVDLAKMIASELGVQVEFLRTATSFEGVVDQVMRQEADMAISKISLTLNRAKRVLYTDPYFVFRQALLINRILLEQYPTGISVAHLAERSDIKIAVLEGTSYAQFAERLFPKASLMRAQDWHAEITPAVAEGLVLAAFRDELEVIRALRTIPQGTLKMVAVVLSDREDPLMMVLPPQSHGLRLWLNLFLRAKSVRFNLDYLKQHYRDYL